MKKIILLFFVSMFFFNGISQTQNSLKKEIEVKVFIDNPKQAAFLYNLHLKGEVYPIGYGWFELSSEQLELIKNAGLRYEIYENNFSENTSGTLEAFHNYYQILELMDSLATAYPSICKKYTAGTSAGGNAIVTLKISDNADIEENEPEIIFDAGIHGDELVGQEITIRLARYLCTRYTTDPYIQQLVDNREIWIYPNVNPDGRIALDRYNANGQDVNRDWGYMWYNETTAAWSQPETKALRQIVFDNQFVIHTSYHGGTEYLSYPWSYRPDTPPDLLSIDFLAELYSTTSGYANLPYGQGYTGMYPINGASKDANYGLMGSTTWSCEVSMDKMPSPSTIPTYWNYNLPSQLKMIEYAGYGIEGTITDALTGAPVEASIYVGNNFPIYSDPVVGDYHKFLVSGTYNLKIVANGYQTAIVPGVIVNEEQSTITNITLEPQFSHFALKVTGVVLPGNNFSDEGYTPAILGSADFINYSLGKNGWITVDMGTPIPNLTGNDIKIVEGDTSPEGFSCYAGQSLDGPWQLLGQGTGTTEFDLSNIPLVTEARYFKIVDDGDGSASAPNAGFDIDAIQGLEQPLGTNLLLTSYNVDDLSGNGNKRMDPGETVNINVIIANSGDIAAENVSTIISCDTTYISLISASATSEVIMPGNSDTLTFICKAKENTPASETVVFQLDLSANSGSYTNSYEMQFMIGIIVEDWETGNFEKFDWNFSGNSQWTISDSDPYEGTFCSGSGSIGDSQSSELFLEANVFQNGSISFFRKTSSEADYDFLKFFIDDELKGQWSGETPWAEVSFPVTAGEHNLRWVYSKDVGTVGGSDCAWVDYIILPKIQIPGTGSVSGTVTSQQTGLPIAGATITLSQIPSDEEFNTISGADGTYSFTNIPEGNYLLCAWAPNFDTSCYTRQITSGEQILQDFLLISTVGTHDILLNNNVFIIYPNPMDTKSTLQHSVETKCFVSLDIYNLTGEIVKNLSSGTVYPGIYSIDFNGENIAGKKLPGGIYIVKLRKGNSLITRKLIIK